ncbi:MAG: aminotransferase class I/II-fold pyridoxal phosphate-dependent enzyme [Saprospiraceae bacterium]|nr:aminotransferase class I/II-fold pyridoxal phosphate-dependent enzyme [Saprospiraceae bacterium]
MLPKIRINLISDTVTRPTEGMLARMMSAETGDDVFREDPTVNELEERMAEMFNQEAGLFCPSGTMTNQIATKAHTQPLDEMLCDVSSHVYQYEVGGYAFHSGIAVTPIDSPGGKLTSALLADHIRPAQDWFPNTRLVVVENTGNRAGGIYYSLEELRELSVFCRSSNLQLHLDGARIFNAMLAGDYGGHDVGSLMDSISVCLSKGLGAPVGSVLLGNYEFIARARKLRKVMGGGMRQSGILAAAGLYALDHHIDRLRDDHHRAHKLRQTLLGCPFVRSVKDSPTNILIFELEESLGTASFLHQLRIHGIQASAFGRQSIRFVTHLDVSDEMIEEVCRVLEREISVP